LGGFFVPVQITEISGSPEKSPLYALPSLEDDSNANANPDDVTNRVLTSGKEGWVLKRHHGAVMTTWKPVYLRVRDDSLIEVGGDGGGGGGNGNGASEETVLCNLALLNVRASEKAIHDRLDCLDLVTPHLKMVMQCEGPRDMAEWQLVLSSGIVSAIHSGNTHGLTEVEADELLSIDGNSECADCREPRPMWCSINLGITVCLRWDARMLIPSIRCSAPHVHTQTHTHTHTHTHSYAGTPTVVMVTQVLWRASCAGRSLFKGAICSSRLVGT
jgi:hypothetical protein